MSSSEDIPSPSFLNMLSEMISTFVAVCGYLFFVVESSDNLEAASKCLSLDHFCGPLYAGSGVKRYFLTSVLSLHHTVIVEHSRQ